MLNIKYKFKKENNKMKIPVYLKINSNSYALITELETSNNPTDSIDLNFAILYCFVIARSNWELQGCE